MHMDPRVATTTPLPPEPSTPTMNTTPATPPADGKFGFLKSKKAFIILAGTLFIVLVGVSIWYFLKAQKETAAPTPPSATKPSNTLTQDIKTYPKFKFTYQTPTAFPQSKPTLLSYEVKHSFTESDISSFGAQFGFEKPDSTQDGLVHYADFKNPNSRGYLTLDTTTGGFDYQNMAQSNRIESTDPKLGALNFLKKIGLNDDLVTCDITYNINTLPGITYVECHRSWEKMGAPLLNLPGVLNIPETTPLSTLQLGYNSTPLSNPSIINVSTGQNGVNRPNDFNTATFAVSSDGTILSIVSNLRWITQENEENLVTPSQAFEILQQNKADQTIAIPAGTGDFNWDKVFPLEGVTGQNASINSFELVYVENELSQKQKTYIPTYLFRGNVRTNTGYSINFVQTVPAVLNSSQPISENTPKDNLQLQTFQLSPTLTRAPITKATITPQPTIAPYDCSDDSNISSSGIKGYTQPIAKFTVNINGAQVQLASLESYPNTFFLNQGLSEKAVVQKYKSELYRLIGEQIAWNYKNGKEPNIVELPANTPSGYIQDQTAYMTAKGVYESLINNPNAVINPQLPTLIATTALSLSPNYAANPCYLTGLSPTIFLYSNNNTIFKVKPSYTTKTEPILSNYVWTINANKNGMLTSSNSTNEYLYYEFDKQFVDFEKQEKGFVMDKEDIKPFAPKLAKLMKLNTKESERLLFELELAAKELPADTEYIKLSLVPQDELNSRLPLRVSPKPEYSNRYHFLLSKVDKQTKQSMPTIHEVKRGKSTLVEIGASAN